MKLPKRLYFQIVPGDSPEATPYPHLVIALGEGLRQLGVALYANVDYWRPDPESPETLFRHDPAVGPEDCAIVLLTEHWFTPVARPLPQPVADPSRENLWIYVDGGPDTDHRTRALPWNEEFRQFDFILKNDCSRNFRYPAHLVPWANGLTERMLRECAAGPPFQERRRVFIQNFRHGRWKHSVRHLVERSFTPRMARHLPLDTTGNSFEFTPRTPYEELMWRQTGRRHTHLYFETLRNAMACSAFSGFFFAPWSHDPTSLGFRLQRRFFTRSGFHTSRVTDWDNWRFWESLAAGCATFHLDLEQYGALLPVPPENWRHYIGVDLRRIDEAVDRIGSDPGLLESVAHEGREWVLRHYAPLPVTRRFLAAVGGLLERRARPDLLQEPAALPA